MLDFEDPRWTEMTGGYRTSLDPRPMLTRLENDSDTTTRWQELWNELHHQGDVGDASYASVPYLVRAYRKRGVIDGNTFAIVSVIELARTNGNNPDVPAWLKEDYFAAIRELAEMGVSDIFRTENVDEARSILSILAIERGLRTHAKVLVDYTDSELSQIESNVNQARASAG